MLAWLIGQPLTMKPLWISKLNTVAQIAFVGLVLGALGLSIDAHMLLKGGSFVVAGFTLISGAFYLRDWVKHMGGSGEKL